MKILSKYMDWQIQNPVASNKGKLFTASNDASYGSTEGRGLRDDEILHLLFSASNGRDNIKLFNGDTSSYNDDNSAADQAFVNKIAFYTQLPGQIDSIFRLSKLMRNKWDVQHSATGETYGEMTINKALEDLIDTYSIPKTKKSTGRAFRLIAGSEIIKRNIKTDWLIEDHIPRDSTVLIFGEPESGKSLIALEMACCIASGQNWTDKPVKLGEVIYIAGEGFNGLSKRLNALAQEKGLSVEHLHCSESAMDLMLDDSVEEVLEIVRNIQNLRLIIIDTLHRNSTGDENNSREFAVILKHCDQLRSATGATIMLVHHSGLGDKDRGRGSSSIRGAMDAEFKISQGNGVIKIHCTKMKDDEKPKDIKFDLKSVTLGEDEDGKAITGPILEKSTTFFTADNSATLNRTEKLTLAILNQLTGENRTPVSSEEWEAACMKKYTTNSLSEEKAIQAKIRKFARNVNLLLNKSVVVEDSGCFTVTDPDATTEGGER